MFVLPPFFLSLPFRVLRQESEALERIRMAEMELVGIYRKRNMVESGLGRRLEAAFHFLYSFLPPTLPREN